MVEIATVGAHECLRSGVTTIGDCSFSGAAAIAAAATGLRAIVYLEVFSSDGPALERFHESRGRIESVLSDRVLLGVSPHAPYTCTIETYRACAELGLPQATHFAESAAERDWLVDGTGDWSPLAEFLVPPSGETGIRMLAAEGLLGPGPDGRALRACRRRGDRPPGPARRRRRALPALERLPRLRRRAAAGASRRRGGRFDRDRQPRVDPVARPVRGDPHRRSSARAPAKGGPMRSPLQPRSSWRRSAAPACSEWTTGSDRSCPASRPIWP